MKKIAIVIGVFVLLLAFVGCLGVVGGSTEAQNVSESHTEPTRAASKASTPAKTAGTQKKTTTSIYLKSLKDNYPQFKKADDKTLVAAGKEVCTNFKKGFTFTDIAVMMIEVGIPADATGYLIGAATASFCPQYIDRIGS